MKCDDTFELFVLDATSDFLQSLDEIELAFVMSCEGKFF